jgi:hypothetical protein
LRDRQDDKEYGAEVEVSDYAAGESLHIAARNNQQIRLYDRHGEPLLALPDVNENKQEK